LLSKYPIATTAQPEKLDYVISGKPYTMQRGILDATVKTPDGRPWRFLGVHLKSKREVNNGDQNLMRINEAQLLRRHIEGILKQDPQARLICYGDFNDTRRTSPLRIVQGSYNSANYMTPIALHDSRNEYWTHYWEREDIYSRIDYIHYSPGLKNDVLFQECGIVDVPTWRKASDHRAIKAAFR
jgi:endonuclease/exonuclease/phosphatase family metal-dependent hydrolase